MLTLPAIHTKIAPEGLKYHSFFVWFTKRSHKPQISSILVYISLSGGAEMCHSLEIFYTSVVKSCNLLCKVLLLAAMGRISAHCNANNVYSLLAIFSFCMLQDVTLGFEKFQSMGWGEVFWCLTKHQHWCLVSDWSSQLIMWLPNSHGIKGPLTHSECFRQCVGCCVCVCVCTGCCKLVHVLYGRMS